MEQDRHIILFQEKTIRRVWHGEEWYFVITDVVGALTDSSDPKRYLTDMRRRDAELSKGWLQIATPLLVQTAGGRQKLNCANSKGLFRLIMAIPSPKAEPFKLWLAQVGSERIQEIENPELAAQRARSLYRAKGYSDDWIEMRMKSIELREQLTDEWKGRGVQEGIEYSILTAEISKATFGMAPSDYKKHKGLKRENLRDHMTNLELIFTMLGEESTKTKAIAADAQGFLENHDAAVKGGRAAGKALNAYEEETGDKVISEKNYLGQIREAKKGKRGPGPADEIE